ncbi:hypothetical protein Anacy_4838 [Anabaena cylindrica PCC 7122]|uniref:Uncharacterized protein n=1 Tax=Anabaena cylindrica (strain ATCC 27899 / PCC 7122) TaxID=272123 RepID=K9ZLX3_ANACC|nr:hypothetical protein Anacy_4838 [Anabaena cylindrica PCC 7122]BAY02751.1 hypothetical protein NIES19_19980 [Anabaena cylindrica PCC 7122]
MERIPAGHCVNTKCAGGITQYLQAFVGFHYRTLRDLATTQPKKILNLVLLGITLAWGTGLKVFWYRVLFLDCVPHLVTTWCKH